MSKALCHQGALVRDLSVLSASPRPKDAVSKYKPTQQRGGVDYRGSMLLGMDPAGDLHISPHGGCPEIGSTTDLHPR